MIYLDSCILIYRLEGLPVFSEAVASAIGGSSGEVFCISDLVRLECLVGPIRASDPSRKAAFEAHFRTLRRVALTRTVYYLAAEIRALDRLKTADAIHVAAALAHGCRQFWTNDRRLGAIENRLEIRVLP